MTTSRKVYCVSVTDRDGDVLSVYNAGDGSGGLTIVSNGEASTAKRPPGTESTGFVELTPESSRRFVAAVMDLRENVEPPPDPWSPGLAAPNYRALKWLTWGADGPQNMRGPLVMVLRPPTEPELVFAIGANRNTAGAVLADRQVDELVPRLLALLNGTDPADVELGKPLI